MSLLEIKRTTLADFEVMTTAFELRQVDDRFIASYQAWQTVLAGSSDNKGKPVFKSFKKLFDYKKEVDEIIKADKKEVKSKNMNIFERIKELNRE